MYGVWMIFYELGIFKRTSSDAGGSLTMTKLLGEYRYMYISDTSLGYCLFSNTAPLFERLIA